VTLSSAGEVLGPKKGDRVPVAENAVERRLAAILAADVVGYSKLMGQDETGTLAALRKLRAELIDPRISEHKGRIFKTTGDGLLAEFPSVVNAVACAVEIQQSIAVRNAELPEDSIIEVRIGINLGDVIIEDDDVFGDGVNVAARLEALAPSGGIAISGTVRDHLSNRLSIICEDVGERQLKNINQPVRVFLVRSGKSKSQHRPTHIAPHKPSIAVLPFTNLSADLEQGYLSDGIAEDIITELSRYQELLVVARNSSFHYRDTNLDMKRVGRELGVEYLVEGSLRKAGNRLRITVQLIEAASGVHLWAEKYDRDLVDFFAIQDDVTQSVSATLVGRVVQSGVASTQRKPTEQWVAHDYVLQARHHSHRYDIDAALLLLQRALALDPLYAQAHAYLTSCYFEKYYLDADSSMLAPALSHASKALSIDPNDGMCHLAMGYAHTASRNYDLGGLHLASARALNPNSVQFERAYGFSL
jgi:adenylate cyclase